MVERHSDCLLSRLREVTIYVQMRKLLSKTRRPYEALLIRDLILSLSQFRWGGGLQYSNGGQHMVWPYLTSSPYFKS